MGVCISKTSSRPQPHFHEHGHDRHLDEHTYRHFQRSLEGKIKEHGVRCNQGLSKSTILIWFAGYMTDADRGLNGIGEILPLEP
jgi:hypothetical protein